jgi:hypothetical protein
LIDKVFAKIADDDEVPESSHAEGTVEVIYTEESERA